MGRIKRESIFLYVQNAYSDHLAHAQRIIRAFALYSYILCTMILLLDSKGPDQVVQMHRQSMPSLSTHFARRYAFAK